MSIASLMNSSILRAAEARKADSAANAAGGFAQQLADAGERLQGGFAKGTGQTQAAAPSRAEQEFMEYAALSPQEKLFRAALASLGISKEEYDAMTPQQKQALAEKIQIAMQQALDAKKVGDAA
ncbi:MAG: hypothetical protein REJ50_26800 [Bordetella sp.]|nr:hypothetical protein [Bordetella sp.]